VSRDASPADIKRAYYAQAKKYHPDTNKNDPAAAKKFAAITEAYELLSDSTRRQAYDTFGREGEQAGAAGGMGGFHQGFHQGFASPEELMRAFQEAFGGGGGGFASRRRANRGRDVTVQLTVTLEEVAHGCQKTATWRSSSGEERKLQVNVPAGIDSGMNMCLEDQGEPGPQPGDLYLTFVVLEHPVFERAEQNLHVKVRLTLPEALLGAKVVVPTLSGNVSVKVPPGTKTGDRRVIQGHGLPSAMRSGKGHQYIHFEVVMPKQLSKRARELIEELASEVRGLSDSERSKRSPGSSARSPSSDAL